jgi:hypothetical protein
VLFEAGTRRLEASKAQQVAMAAIGDAALR